VRCYSILEVFFLADGAELGGLILVGFAARWAETIFLGSNAVPAEAADL
jgi:hypothetical protein